jgi:hypothetical protein
LSAVFELCDLNAERSGGSLPRFAVVDKIDSTNSLRDGEVPRTCEAGDYRST